MLNTNFCANQMPPINCRWKLVRHFDCFGDNRRTKDTRKIKLCCLKARCVTLFNCSISHIFPALKSWNKKSEVKLKKSRNKQGLQKGKHLRNQRQHFCLQRNSPMKGNLHISVSEAK